MIDVIRIAEAVHKTEQIADRRHDILACDRAVLIVARRRAEHPVDLAVRLLYAERDELAIAEEHFLTLFTHGVHHVLRNRLALGEYDFARFLIDDRLGKYLPEQTAPPAEFFCQFIATDCRQIVTARIKEQHLQELARIVLIRRLARAQAAVDLNDRLAARLDLIRIAFNRREDARIVAEERTNIAVRLVAERTDKVGHRHFARAVDAHGHDIVCVRFELDPRAAVRNNRRIVEFLARCVDLHAIIRAGRAHELTDNDALRTVDDERPCVRHEREIAHKHFLLLDLARLAVDETHIHTERCGVRYVALLTLVEIVFRCAERKRFKGKDEIPREILNGGNIAENLSESHIQEPPIARPLNIEQVRHLHNFLDARIAIPGATADRHRIEHERCHPFAGLS